MKYWIILALLVSRPCGISSPRTIKKNRSDNLQLVGKKFA